VSSILSGISFPKRVSTVYTPILGKHDLATLMWEFDPNAEKLFQISCPVGLRFGKDCSRKV